MNYSSFIIIYLLAYLAYFLICIAYDSYTEKKKHKELKDDNIDISDSVKNYVPKDVKATLNIEDNDIYEEELEEEQQEGEVKSEKENDGDNSNQEKKKLDNENNNLPNNETIILDDENIKNTEISEETPIEVNMSGGMAVGKFKDLVQQCAETKKGNPLFNGFNLSPV